MRFSPLRRGVNRQFPSTLRAGFLLMCSVLLGVGLFLYGKSLGFAATKEQQSESRSTPAAHVLHNEFASEHWEFTARFDSGHLLFVHFLITNIGWGDHNAAMIGHVVTPDGHTHRFGSSRRERSLQLSSDRRRLEVGPHILDLHDPDYHLQVNKKHIRLDLRFQADGTTTWSEALTRSGYALDLLAAAVPVEGSLWMETMNEPMTVHGTLAATHSWMQEAGSAVLVRRLEFFTLRKDFPLYGIDLITPTGAHLRWLIVKQPGKQHLESEAFELALAPESEPEKDPGYTVPGEIRLKSATLNGQVTLERIVLRYDPFARLPGPLRFLASKVLSLNPRQVWAVSPFSLTIPPEQASTSLSPQVPAESSEQHGTGVTAITFLNPLPDAHQIESR